MSACRYCGASLSPFKLGEVREFCDDQCRDAWHDALEVLAHGEMAVSEIEVHGRRFPVESCSIDSDARVVLRFSRETAEAIARHINESKGTRRWRIHS